MLVYFARCKRDPKRAQVSSAPMMPEEESLFRSSEEVNLHGG